MESAYLNNISHLYKVKENLNATVEYLEQSLMISRKLGNRQGEGVTLSNIAAVYEK